MSQWWVGDLGDRAEHAQDSFRGYLCEHTPHTRYAPSSIQYMCRSPALMYLMCPATHTTKLPSGRPSTNCLRLRSYSPAGIPGVISPCFTFSCAHQRRKGKRRRWWAAGSDGVVLGCWLLTYRGVGGILRWVDRMWTAWLALLSDYDDAGVGVVLELGQ